MGVAARAVAPELGAMGAAERAAAEREAVVTARAESAPAAAADPAPGSMAVAEREVAGFGVGDSAAAVPGR